MKHAFLIAYDISCPKRLRRALKILKAWRLDGQKSVHECLLSIEQLQRLRAQLTDEMNPDEDKLLIVRLDRRRPIHVQGTAGGLGIFKRLFHIR